MVRCRAVCGCVVSRVRKAIAYAYPSSVRAGELGSAGWYVEQYRMREDGTWSAPFIAQGCHDVFPASSDPDLLALFGEADGEPCPYWLGLAGVTP